MAPITLPIALRDYLQETEDAISTGRVDDALARCENILAQFPDSLEAQRLLGEVYLAQGSLENAQQTFDWVLTNDPENVIVYCDRALVCERKADYDMALDCYQQAYELSRGNSHIRNEFNKLSAKTGQQGFMFSRAGLARLYMRGDLLTQAIQEWETVLSSSPDRLDARTGLLETYWREGLNEQVEQLATQILQDVPGCEKAILLLAYVASTKDIQQAQGLLRRAEALDPDLVMAQDLFADLIASQPDEPFLQLLKKSPASLIANSEKPAALATQAASADQEEPSAPANNVQKVSSAAQDWSGIEIPSTPPNSALSWPGAEIPPTPLNSAPSWPGVDQPAPSISQPSWPGIDAWGSDKTVAKPSDEAQTPAERDPSNIPLWSNESFAAADGWNIFNKQQEGSDNVNHSGGLEQEVLDQLGIADQSPHSEQNAHHGEAQPEPWQLLQASLNEPRTPEGSNGLEQTKQEIHEAQSAYEVQPWQSMGESSNRENLPDSTWSSTSKESDVSSPPAWLNMLTQGERRQMSEELPGQSSTVGQEEQVVQNIYQPPVEPEASRPPVEVVPEPQLAPQKEPEQPASPPVFVEEQDEEESFFGPEWLKALGATSMDGEEPEAGGAEVAPEVIAQEKPQPPVQQISDPQPSAMHESWVAPPQSVATPPVQPQAPAMLWGQPVETIPSVPAPKPVQEQLEELARSTQGTENIWNRFSDSVRGVQDSPSEVASPVQPVNPLWSEPAGVTSPPPATAPAWDAQEPAEQVAETEEEREQSVLKTLEDLEKNLRSKGFEPMESNTLSSIAKEQGAAPTASPYPYVPQTQEPGKQEQQGMQQEAPSLSSALAELGNFVHQTVPQEKFPTAPPVNPVTPELSTPVQEEPQWIKSLRATPTFPPTPPMPEEEEETVHRVMPTSPAFSPDTTTGPVQPAARADMIQGLDAQTAPTFPPARRPVEPMPAEASMPEPVRTSTPPPAARSEALDVELETTMKRPAIRLQPQQQQRSVPPRDPSMQYGKGRGEQQASKASDNRSPSNRERLLKGYQSQLTGEYDEAMQEYRVVIRNAPELLGDVVSNVRALLKLAPKYSAGYRVLGDAYMRQGEYLQAMEAYNKALTMAKKAKA